MDDTLPPDANDDVDDIEDDEAQEDLLHQLHDMPVGTRDPNIVGDAGPFDVPPGADPPAPPSEG